MEDKRINLIEQAINELAYTDEQKQESFKILEEIKPKIKKVISVMVYKREDGIEISALTIPDYDLKFYFKKI